MPSSSTIRRVWCWKTCRCSSFKLGVLGSVETVATVAEIVSDYPDIPLILDPVLASGRGDVFADDDVLGAIRELLVPQATIITPNSIEARRLASQNEDGEEDSSRSTCRCLRQAPDRMGHRIRV